MPQSDILVQLHLPSLPQLKKMGMQFFSLIWNCHTVVFCTSVTPCKLLRIADPQSDSSRFKGHGMLAPFTAGWQSNDLHPLIIERSEVATLSFSIIFVTSLEI